MNKIIYISDDIISHIDIPKNKKNDTIILNDFKELNKIKHSNKKFLLLFVSSTNLKKLLKILDNHNNLKYKIIILNPNIKTSISLFNNKNIYTIRNSDITSLEYNNIKEKAFLELTNENEKQSPVQFKDIYNDQELLVTIGKKLFEVLNDQDNLLKTILILSKKITAADAGTIYLVDEDENGTKLLNFRHAFTYSKGLSTESYEDNVIPLNKKSIAGYVALTGNTINIDDVYKLKQDEFDGIKHNRKFDRENNYITKSMLAVPMRNHLNEISGVIQLINCKENKKNPDVKNAHLIKLKTRNDFENKVFSFDARYENMMQAVAGQAAISIENFKMIKQIQFQLEEFVKASMAAIETRDLPTSGHSLRVAKLCVETAKAINRVRKGPVEIQIQFIPIKRA